METPHIYSYIHPAFLGPEAHRFAVEASLQRLADAELGVRERHEDGEQGTAERVPKKMGRIHLFMSIYLSIFLSI